MTQMSIDDIDIKSNGLPYNGEVCSYEKKWGIFLYMVMKQSIGYNEWKK